MLRVQDTVADEEEASEEDAADAMDEGDIVRQEDEKDEGRPGAAQTPALYTHKGQFNPHAARAEKKRAKKRAKAQALVDDYDFEEAFGEPALQEGEAAPSAQQGP